jgi:hypothetical protein
VGFSLRGAAMASLSGDKEGDWRRRGEPEPEKRGVEGVGSFAETGEGAPTLRALARLNPFRPCKVGIGPAQVVLFLYFFFFCFFLFSFLKFKKKITKFVQISNRNKFYFKQILILNKI